MDNVINIDNVSKSYFVNTEYNNLFQRLFHKHYKEIVAISDLSLKITDGEMVALLGKNGAGKTTLIKLMTGILTPTSGNIEILGYNPYHSRYQYTYQIGVVLGQKSLLWYNIPVEESLKLYKRIYEVDDRAFQDRIDLFDSILDIGDLLKTPVRKLSLGQRMKCELAAALLHRPRIIFLDEPTIGLDVLTRRKIYEFLNCINKEEKSIIILTTHNIDDVEKLCNRVILLDEGKMVFDGAKESLCELDRYKTIAITGEVKITSDMEPYLVSSKENTYNFKVPKERADIINSLMSNLGDNGDISVQGSSLEDIIIQIYEGKVII